MWERWFALPTMVHAKRGRKMEFVYRDSLWHGADMLGTGVASFGHMGGCIDNFSHFFFWQGPNVHDLWRDGVEVHEDGRFFPDLCVEEAGKFMEESSRGGSPFFLYWPTPSAHGGSRPW